MNIVRNFPWRDLPVYIVGGIIAAGVHGVLHENAHAVAARLLFNDANPVITYKSFYFGGGICNTNPAAPLSSLGRLFDKAGSDALVNAAGPVANTLIYLAASFFQSPLIAKAFVFSNLNHVFYAFKNEGFSDFINVTNNVGEWASAALMITQFAALALAHRPIFKGTYAKVAKVVGGILISPLWGNFMEKVGFSLALRLFYKNAHTTAKFFSKSSPYRYKMEYPPELTSIGQIFGKYALPLAFATGPLLIQGLVHGGLSRHSKTLNVAMFLAGISSSTRALSAMVGGENEFYLMYEKGGLLPPLLLGAISLYTAARTIAFLYQSCKKEKVG